MNKVKERDVGAIDKDANAPASKQMPVFANGFSNSFCNRGRDAFVKGVFMPSDVLYALSR